MKIFFYSAQHPDIFEPKLCQGKQNSHFFSESKNPLYKKDKLKFDEQTR